MDIYANFTINQVLPVQAISETQRSRRESSTKHNPQKKKQFDQYLHEASSNKIYGKGNLKQHNDI